MYTEVHTAGNKFDAGLFYELLVKHGLSVVGTHSELKKIYKFP